MSACPKKKLKEKYVSIKKDWIGHKNAVVLTILGQSFGIMTSVPGDRESARFFAKQLRRALWNLVEHERSL